MTFFLCHSIVIIIIHVSDPKALQVINVPYDIAKINNF